MNKAWVAGDIGSQIVNPGAAENLTQGAVVDGMSEMLQGISLRTGRVAQANYRQHPMPMMSQTPPIEVRWLRTDNPPTGERIRTLPITKRSFNFA